MKRLRQRLLTPRIRERLAELQRIIRERFPEAEFSVFEGEDPVGIYMPVYTDADDAFDVLDLVNERVADIIAEEEVIIGVVPLPRAARDNAPLRHAQRRAG